MLVLVLVASGLAAVTLTQLDPIQKYFQGGKLVLRGGAVTGELIGYLQHGPRETNTTHFTLANDGRPTGHFVAANYPPLEQQPTGSSKLAAAPWRSARNFSIPDIPAVLLNELRGAVGWFFSLFTTNAAAACGAGSGSCFYIGGTGNFSGTAHWSASSGGGTCTCVPATTDLVTFDAASGAGTATQDNVSLTTAGAIFTNSSVTVALSSNTWTVTGSWTNPNNHVTGGTSSVIITSGSSLGVTFANNVNEFYNLTFDSTVAGGVTWTMVTNALQVSNGLTVRNTAGSASGNTILDTTGSNFAISVSGGITLGTRGTLTANASTITFGTGWDSSASNATFNKGTSTAVTGGTGNINNPSGFYNLTVQNSASKVLVAALTVTNALNVGDGVTCSTDCYLDLNNTSNYALTAGTLSILGKARLLARASTITVNGTWDASTGTSASAVCNSQLNAGFDCGTSTVVVNASATVKSDGSPGHWGFYNLTVANNVTMTMTSALVVGNALSVGGAGGGTITCSPTTIRLFLASSTTFTVGSGVTTLSCSFEPLPTSAFTLPGLSYGALVLAGSATITLGGNVTTTSQDGSTGRGIWALEPLDTSSSNYSVSVNGGFDMYVDSGGSTATRNSVVTVTGSVAVAAASAYTTSTGSGSWTIAGAWTNNSTSSSWSFAAPVTFNSASSRTMTFCGAACGGGTEFTGNITFDQGSAGTGIQYTMAAALSAGTSSAITIQRLAGSGTVTLSTGASGFSVTGGNFTIAANATFTAFAGSVITVNGNWTSSAGTATFNQNTSTVILAASGNVASNANSTSQTNGFYNLTVNVNKTATFTTDAAVGFVLTVNGTLTWSASGSRLGIGLSATSQSNPVVIGGSGAITGASGGDLLYWQDLGGASVVHVPAGTYTNVDHRLASRAVAAGDGTEFRLDGNIAADQIEFVGFDPTMNFFFNSQTFNVTLNNTGASIFGTSNVAPNSIGIKATSGTWTILGTVDLSATSTFEHLFIQFGSSNWAVRSWTNNLTTNSAKWQAGTGTVTFNSTTNRTVTFAGATVGNEFNNVTFDPNANATPVYVMAAALQIAGTLKMQNSFGASSSVTLDVTASSYQITANTIQLTFLDNSGLIAGRNGRIITTNWNVSKYGYSTSCFSAPLNCSSTGIVEFTGTGTIIGKNCTDCGDFWKVQIDLGAVTTNTTQTTILDTAIINGALRATDDTIPFVINDNSSSVNPATIGVSADLTLCGYFYYNMRGNGASFNVAGGTFERVAIIVGASQTVSLAGDLTSPTEFIIAMGTHGPASKGTFNTSNYAITITGVTPSNFNSGVGYPIGSIFLGDTTDDGLNINFGSSTITSLEFAILTTTVLNLQTSHLILTPFLQYNPVTWILEDDAIVHGGTAIIDAHGSWTMLPDVTALGGVFAEGATWNIYSNQGTCSTNPSFGCPGDVIIKANNWISFGTSTWNVQGSWTNVSNSASWSFGTTAVISFTGSGTITSSTGLSTGEFPTVVFGAGSSYVQVNDLTMAKSVTINGLVQFPSGGGSGNVSVTGLTLITTAGYMTLGKFASFVVAANQVNITFIMSDSVSAAQVTITIANLLLYSRIYVDGSGAGTVQPSQSALINSSWSTHVVQISNSYQPPGSAPLATVTCTQQYLLLGVQVTCSTNDPSPQNYYWYLNGKFEGTGSGFTDYVWIPFGFSAVANVSVQYLAIQPIGSAGIVLDAAPNVLVWLALAAIGAILGRIIVKPRGYEDEDDSGEERAFRDQEDDFNRAVYRRR